MSEPDGPRASPPAGTPAPSPAGTPASSPAGSPASSPAGTPAPSPAGTPAPPPAGPPASSPAGSPASPPAPLAGRVAVVTGGSGGIGRAICTSLREAGATVVSLDIASPQIECDVRDDASVAKAIAHVVATHGRIDIAVHAAGITRDAVVWKLSLDDWDVVQEVNLRGAFLLVRNVVPAMREGGGGRIILIGSINGSRGKIGTSAYSASKAGLIGLSKSVSRETGRFGIRVNVIEPGWVRTPLTETFPDDVREKARNETQLGELVEPEDVAAAVVFLSGDASRRITGQILRVDSGQYL